MTPVDPLKPYTMRAIFESVAQNLDAKMKGLGLTPPATAFGQKQVARLQSAPRIICVPTSGRQAGMLGRNGNGVDKPWALWGRMVTCQFHVWGLDEDDAELLAFHFLASLHDLRAGFYEYNTEEWIPSGDGDLGQLIVITASIYTIWSREFIPAVQAQRQVITGGIVPPS